MLLHDECHGISCLISSLVPLPSRLISWLFTLGLVNLVGLFLPPLNLNALYCTALYSVDCTQKNGREKERYIISSPIPSFQAKAVKNFSVLSFGEEAEDDENQLDEAIEKSFKNKSKSLHDAKVDPKMVADPALAEDRKDKTRGGGGGGGGKGEGGGRKFAEPEGLEEDSEEDSDEEQERKDRERDAVRDKLKDNEKKKKREEEEEAEKQKNKKKEEVKEELDSDEEERMAKRRKLEEMQRESKKLMNELRPKKEKDKTAIKEEEEDEEKVELKGDEDEITKFKAERLKYVKQKKDMKKKGQDRQDLTLQLLAKFQNKVKESQVSGPRCDA